MKTGSLFEALAASLRFQQAFVGHFKTVCQYRYREYMCVKCDLLTAKCSDLYVCCAGVCGPVQDWPASKWQWLTLYTSGHRKLCDLQIGRSLGKWSDCPCVCVCVWERTATYSLLRVSAICTPINLSLSVDSVRMYCCYFYARWYMYLALNNLNQCKTPW